MYQEKVLMESFQAKHYLENEEIHQLAKSLNISKTRINKWYSNRRYTSKTKGLLAEGVEHSTKYLLLIKLFRVMYIDYIHGTKLFFTLSK